MTLFEVPRLAISGLTAGYGARRVLRDLAVPELCGGEVTALVGPNGAGKSTLLRVLAGLLPADGSVRLGERELLPLSARARAEHVSYMPQALPQRVALTVLEGVVAALRATPLADLHGMDGGTVVQRAIAMLDQTGIGELAHRPVEQLSGGQRQLASLAQAMVRGPAVLLLDEPTSALDLRHQVVVVDLVRRYAAAGRVVIVVVHDLTLAARWADRVIVLAQGRAHANGSPAAALTPAVLGAVYGVEARLEHCTRGELQIMVDGLVSRPPAQQEDDHAVLR